MTVFVQGPALRTILNPFLFRTIHATALRVPEAQHTTTGFSRSRRESPLPNSDSGILTLPELAPAANSWGLRTSTTMAPCLRSCGSLALIHRKRKNLHAKNVARKIGIPYVWTMFAFISLRCTPFQKDSVSPTHRFSIIPWMPVERDLIERSRNGDSTAFTRLIGRYEDRIFRLAKHVCAGLPAEADDVYQETFLTAFKKLRSFRGDSDLGTWLYRIASNLCLMRHRKKKSEPFVPLLDRAHDHNDSPAHQFRDWRPTPEEAANKKELMAKVTGALAKLPIDYRLVVTLRDVEGLSAEETAKILKLSVGAVKSRLHRGRLILRDEFERSFSKRETER